MPHYEKPSQRRARKDEEADHKAANKSQADKERAERAKEGLIDVFRRLNEAEFPGARPIEILRPARRLEKALARSTFGLVSARAPQEYLEISGFMNTPPRRSDSLFLPPGKHRGSLRGHVAVDVTAGWAESPNFDFNNRFNPHARQGDDKRLITVEGVVYPRFTTVEDFEGFTAVQHEAQLVTDLSAKDQEKITKRLETYLR